MSSSAFSNAALVNKVKNKRATEQKWTFTHPKKRRDASGRYPHEEDYNPRTLFLPSSALSIMSLMERQYWDLKKNHMDKILFFRIGNTYDIFEEDALVGSKEFGLEIRPSRNGGPNMFYCSIPSKQVEEWKVRFVERGFKVAIASESIEVQESAHGTIHKRDIVEVITPGLRDGTLLPDERANNMLAIREDVASNDVGVCFVDVSTGKIFLELLQDDEKRSQLEMLIHQIVPSEIILPRGCYSRQVKRIIHSLGKPDIVTEFEIGSEFLSSSETLSLLKHGNYFSISKQVGTDVQGQDSASSSNYENYPEALRFYLSYPTRGNSLVISCFGAIVSYLKNVERDKIVLSRGDISCYDVQGASGFMLLDGHTLTNLEILTNNYDFSKKGSLLEHMCHCVTPGGKRLFSEWMAHPLITIQNIEDRLDMIDDLNVLGIEEGAFKELSSIPDIERLLQQVFSYHVDSGNVNRIGLSAFKKLEKEKSLLFFKLLNAMKQVCEFMLDFKQVVKEGFESNLPLKSTLLNQILNESFKNHSYESNVGWNDIYDMLAEVQKTFLESSFDGHDDLGFVSGRFINYDKLVDERQSLLQEVNDFISNIQEKWGAKHVKIRNGDLIEVADSISQTCTIPSGWEIQSSQKNAKIFLVPELSEMNKKLSDVTNELQSLVTTIFQQILKVFVGDDPLWKELIHRFSTFDCLFSLWKLSTYPQYVRPEFVSHSEGPVFHVVQGRHPLVETFVSSYVPNDIYIGGHHPEALLITGPNMGGKSTILRQTAILAIMAQIGSFVPAEKCELTPIDRVFTRIGASDRILKGESTFMVEMVETSNILHHSTSRSLIILDELGRGTSTFDGYSIAYATLHYLINKHRPMTLFATHYHNLCQEFEKDSRVRLLRMKFHEVADTPLYQLEPGVSPSSYGMRVARMAGIPEETVQNAERVAKDFEQFTAQECEHLEKVASSRAEMERILSQESEDPLTQEEERIFFQILKNAKNMSYNDIMSMQEELQMMMK